MNYSNEFKNLLPDELEIIKSILDDLIDTVSNDKNTNKKYQNKNKSLNCPRCKSNSIVRNGTKKMYNIINVKIVANFFLYQQIH